jgi:hypothetical protein
MTVYLVKRKNKNKKIVDFSYNNNGYEFKPNIKNSNLISISHLYLVNEDITNLVLKQKIMKEYRRLTAIMLSVLNDDDTTSSDAYMALNEVVRIKGILLKKYANYMKKNEFEKMLKRLTLVEENLKKRLIALEEQEENFTR